MLPLHHGPVKRTTRIERASPEWRPRALPSELRPPSGTPGWSRTSGLCRRRTALSPLSYGRMNEPPAGVEPAPRPYKGRVLAVDTTEAEVETAGVEPAPPRCKRGALPHELHPQGADGWTRTITARGNAFTARRARRCSASARRGDRPDSNRFHEVHNLGCWPLHHSHQDERGRPDSNRRPLA